MCANPTRGARQAWQGARRNFDLRSDHQPGLPKETDRPARNALCHILHQLDRRAAERTLRYWWFRRRGARDRCLFLAYAAPPLALGKPLANARDDGMADGLRRRESVADPDPASGKPWHQHRNPLRAAERRWLTAGRRQ